MTQIPIDISIDKKLVNTMPVVDFGGKIVVVDNPIALKKGLRFLSTQKIVGFDTETRPSFKAGVNHKVALMQVSTMEYAFLIRLNRVGMPQGVRDFIENKDIIKVGLSLTDDLGRIKDVADVAPAGFIDLQPYVKRYGIADNSLQRIYAILFGERISKGQQLSNWQADTLTPAQQRYAAIDAWACLRIYNHLESGGFDPATCEYRKVDAEEQD